MKEIDPNCSELCISYNLQTKHMSAHISDGLVGPSIRSFGLIRGATTNLWGVNKFVNMREARENDGDVCVMDFSHSIKPTLLATRGGRNPFGCGAPSGGVRRGFRN